MYHGQVLTCFICTTLWHLLCAGKWNLHLPNTNTLDNEEVSTACIPTVHLDQQAY